MRSCIHYAILRHYLSFDDGFRICASWYILRTERMIVRLLRYKYLPKRAMNCMSDVSPSNNIEADVRGKVLELRI